jgi:hypothetical protein
MYISNALESQQYVQFPSFIPSSCAYSYIWRTEPLENDSIFSSDNEESEVWIAADMNNYF